MHVLGYKEGRGVESLGSGCSRHQSGKNESHQGVAHVETKPSKNGHDLRSLNSWHPGSQHVLLKEKPPHDTGPQLRG